MGKRATSSARSRALLIGALVATATLSQMQAQAVTPTPTTVSAAAAADGVINLAEATSLVVQGTYPADPTVVEARIRFRTDGSCDGATVTGTNSPVGPYIIGTGPDQNHPGTVGDGAFASGPIDLVAAGLAHGDVICPVARTGDGSVASLSPWKGADAPAVLDLIGPAAPVIVSPAENLVVPAHFTIGGTATSDAVSVTVFDVTDPVVITVGTAAVPATGDWSIKAFVQKSGPRQFEAVAFDSAGNPSAASAPRTLNVDAAAPTVTIEIPANNALYLPTDTVSVEGIARDSGSGIIGLDVKVFSMGQEVQSAELKTTNGGLTCTAGCPTVLRGTWKFTPNVGTGYFTVKIWAIDAAGNRTVQPAEVNFARVGI